MTFINEEEKQVWIEVVLACLMSGDVIPTAIDRADSITQAYRARS